MLKLPGYAVGNAAGPALSRAGEGEAPKVAARRLPRRDEFLGIFVAQLSQGEVATISDAQGFRQELGGVATLKGGPGLEVTLSVAMER